jgi:cytoskeleton protein RodZ
MSEERAVPDSPVVPEQKQDERAPAPTEETIDVGQRLRLAREARGLSIGEAAAALKLSPHQVEALEADDWGRFPRTVSRGFVRNYARHLKLDATPLMAALDRVPMPRGPELAVGTGASVDMPSEGRRDWRRGYVRVVAGLLVLVLAVLAYFFVPTESWQSGIDSVRALISRQEALPEAGELDGVSGVIVVQTDDTAFPATPALVEPVPLEPAPPAEPAPVETPPVEPMPVEPMPVEPAVPVEPIPAGPLPSAEPAPVETVAEVLVEAAVEPPPPDEALVFSFTQPSWVEVRDRDGQIIHSQLNPGDSRRVIVGQSPFALVVGNASQVTLQYRGRTIDLVPRSRSDVARLTLE